VKDLPGKVRFHFSKALIAEQEGNWLVAEFELNRAVVAEARATAKEPIRNT
jgi:hypothetical protein